MNEFVDLMQQSLMGLLVLILPIISGFIVSALIALKDKWLSELELNKPEFADALKLAVSLAVKAAEGMELGNFITDKKEYAVSIAQKWLDQEGWEEIDISILEAAIESEVLKLFKPGILLNKDNDWRSF